MSYDRNRFLCPSTFQHSLISKPFQLSYTLFMSRSRVCLHRSVTLSISRSMKMRVNRTDDLWAIIKHTLVDRIMSLSDDEAYLLQSHLASPQLLRHIAQKLSLTRYLKSVHLVFHFRPRLIGPVLLYIQTIVLLNKHKMKLRCNHRTSD